MKLILKVLLICLVFLSFNSFARSNEYVSMFKPQKKVKTLLEFENSITKDFSEVRRDITGIRTQSRIELVKNKKSIKQQNNSVGI